MIRQGDWLLTPERAAVHVPSATAVIADLHLGYEEVRIRGGEALPIESVEQRLIALCALAARYAIQRLVIAGDLVERARGGGERVEDLSRCLRFAGIPWVGLVPGNHDRHLDVGGLCSLLPDGFDVGGYRVLHGDGTLPRVPVLHGHIHPCLRWGEVTAPCYLLNSRRLVLPAFSADAAGVNVLNGSRWAGYRCCAIAGNDVLDFGLVGRLKRKRNDERR